MSRKAKNAPGSIGEGEGGRGKWQMQVYTMAEMLCPIRVVCGGESMMGTSGVVRATSGDEGRRGGDHT